MITRRYLPILLAIVMLVAGGSTGLLGQNRGLNDQEYAAVLNMVLNSAFMKDNLQGSRYRVFAVGSTDVKTGKGLQLQAHVLLYDYTKDKTYRAVADVTNGIPGTILEVSVLKEQLPPSAEEYAEAKALARANDLVRAALKSPNVSLQESFPVANPAPCDVHRCVEIQVVQKLADGKAQFLLLVTADLSARQLAEVRQPKNPTSTAR